MKLKWIVAMTLVILFGLLLFYLSIFSQDEQGSPIQGEWEFYWMERFNPEDIKNTSVKPSRIQVPSSWGGQELEGRILTSHGYATYHKKLIVHPEDVGSPKGLYLESIGSAYTLWIDGELILQLGTVGTSLAEETPEFQAKLVTFEPNQETVDIVIQVSNYSFREGGILEDVLYGNTNVLIPSIFKGVLKDVILMGGFLFLGLYHLVVYSIRRKELSILLIGIGGIVAMIRVLFVSEFLVGVIIPIENWEILVKIEYIAELVGFMILILLMKMMYPGEVHTSMLRLSYGFTISFIGYILLTPARIFTETVLIQVSLMAVILLYFVGYVGIVAAIREREGARLNLIALFVIILAMINDVLVVTQLTKLPLMLAYSLINFAMFQAIIISYRYSLLFNKNRTLASELVIMNRTLEEKVSNRTRELNEKNEELGRMQNFRTRMLANIAHDLGSPIVGIQTYLQLMKDGLVQAGNQEVIQQLYGKSDDMKGLIEDLFELTKLESREITFDWKGMEVKSFINDIYRKFEYDLDREGRALRLGKVDTAHAGREAFFRIDPFRMNRVMQNFIDNAVKFSSRSSGTITINCFLLLEELKGSIPHVRMEVIDQGIGITEDELPNVFQRFYKKQDGNENGSGLGLAIVKEIIEHHQGTVGVESEIGQGSVFYVTVPIYLEDN